MLSAVTTPARLHSRFRDIPPQILGCLSPKRVHNPQRYVAIVLDFAECTSNHRIVLLLSGTQILSCSTLIRVQRNSPEWPQFGSEHIGVVHTLSYLQSKLEKTPTESDQEIYVDDPKIPVVSLLSTQHRPLACIKKCSVRLATRAEEQFALQFCW